MQLSSSALSTLKDCPRCFYLDRNLKICRPRGIYPSLPTGVDSVLKAHLEKFRGTLPPQLMEYEELQGFQLYAGADLAKMRNWRSNPLKMTDAKGNVLVGAFDDLLHNPKTGEFAVLDYKTKGTAPDLSYCVQYYQQQVNIYSRFLEIGKKKLAKFAVLLYFWPEPGESSILSFKSHAFFMIPDPAEAEILFAKAIKVLEEKAVPHYGEGCEYCAYVQAASPGRV